MNTLNTNGLTNSSQSNSFPQGAVEPTFNPHIWERLPNETGKAFSGFNAYKKLPPMERSLKRAIIDLYGEHTLARQRQFAEWSGKNSWVARTAAWDNYLSDQENETQIKAVKEMRSRHVRIAQALVSKGVERLKEIDKLELSVQDVLSFILSGSRMERQAIGEPTEIAKVEQSVTVHDFSQLSPDELRKALTTRLISMQDNSFPSLPGQRSIADEEEEELLEEPEEE